MKATIHTMTRGVTSGSASPAWWCKGQDENGVDIKVNVFSHSRVERDTFSLFVADYGVEMGKMQDKDTITWQPPIEVEVVPDGQWLKVSHVAPRTTQAVKKAYVPDFVQWSEYAVQLCQQWLNDYTVVILDTETDGLEANSRIVSIAVIQATPNPYDDDFYHLVWHPEPHTIPAIAQVDRAALEHAFKWGVIYNQLHHRASQRIAIVYNASFDEARLNFMNASHGLAPIPYLVFVDAMQVVSWYLGEWDAGRQGWESIKQTEAYSRIVGGEYPAHNALADVKALQKIINAISNREMVIADPLPF